MWYFVWYSFIPVCETVERNVKRFLKLFLTQEKNALTEGKQYLREVSSNQESSLSA